MKRTLSMVLGWVCLLGCSEAPAPTVVAQLGAAQPDVLVVVLDTVRPDMLSTYGYSKPTAPQLDAVAAAGVTFEDVTAPGSWTWPSHASLFTGVGPWEHGAHASLSEAGVGLSGGHWGLLAMRSDLPTLAERFTAAGYRTVSLASNRFLDPALGLTRGFETAETMHDATLSKRAVELLGEPRDRPLFLFINILLAHAPWEVYPAPWSMAHKARLSSPETAPAWSRGLLMSDPPGIDLYEIPPGSKMGGFRSLMSGTLEIPAEDMPMITDLYTGGITAADFLLNRILTAWNVGRPDGVVAVTSDHGEYLGEHGMWEHGKTVFGEVTSVPLVIAAPGRLPKGRRISTPVQLQDLHDTVLALAGIDVPTPRALLGVIEGEERPGPIQAKAWASRPWRDSVGGVFAHDWSLYREGMEALIFSSAGDKMLFDLSVDGGMVNDLASAKPERVDALWSRASKAFPEGKAASSGPELSAELVEELKALGYLE
jgi:arylsulfatase A-like enzyme